MGAQWEYLCQNCGKRYSKWAGRCQDCGQWNTISAEKATPKNKKGRSQVEDRSTALPITQITTEQLDRLQTPFGELDTILGGGFVPGSVVLLGGEPGIGKSTLLLQAVAGLADRGIPILYVTGEESTSQIALRAKRLNVQAEQLWVLSETLYQNVEAAIDKQKPSVLVIDSIQTLYNTELDSQPGSVSQIKECAHELVCQAKAKGMITLLIGHVTKEGAIAGPKLLEHMVDVVIYFEGTANHSFRVLRSIKNRYGSTNEIGIFEMFSDGIKEVTNPSEIFLSERSSSVPGSVVTSSMEGTRPILIEVQSLVSQSPLSMARRTAIGFDHNRVALLVAILEKRAGFRLFDQDVYINVAGGFKLSEPAVDLAVLVAMISSFSGKPVDNDCLVFGEVGLGGEIRSVPRAETRLKEGARIGLKKAFVPDSIAKEFSSSTNMELIGLQQVGNLSDYF